MEPFLCIEGEPVFDFRTKKDLKIFEIISPLKPKYKTYAS